MLADSGSVPLWTVSTQVQNMVIAADLHPEVIHYSIPAFDECGDGLREISATIQSAKNLLRGDEVLISKLNPRKSRVVLVRPRDLPIVASTEFITLRLSPVVDRTFLAYYLSSDPVREELDSRVQSVTRSHQRVDPYHLARLNVPWIGLAEQRRIVDFLDAEADGISSLRAKREQLITRLDERILAMAAERTGRVGIRSGGQSRAVQIRRVVKRVKTGGTPSIEDGQSFLDDEQDGVPWYGPGCFTDGLTLGPAVKMLTREVTRSGVVPSFSAGSILIVGIGATAGKVAHLGHGGSGNQQITALETGEDILPRFLAWQLWSARSEFLALAPFTTLPIINNDFLKSFLVAVPTLAEQARVVEDLDEEWNDLVEFRNAVARADQLLAERRQALITAAVTGQIDVSTARGVAV